MPDKDVITGTQVVMVVTTEGLTLTLPRGGILRPEQIPVLAGIRFRLSGILWLGEGDVMADLMGSHVVFIAPGGKFATFPSGGTFLVQRDGELATDRGGPAGLFGIRGVRGGRDPESGVAG